MWLDRRLGPVWQLGSDLRTPSTTTDYVPGPIEALPIAMHEVRRPLGLALAYLSMLGEDLVDPTPRQRKLLQEAEVRLSDLRRQLDQLVFLGRTLSGTGWSKLESCDLARELDQVMVRASSEAELAGGRVSVETPQTRVRALADPALLRQLVDNLLNNAIKYSDAAPEVQVEIGSSSRPYLRVVDHGIGMDEQTAATIFTKGFRGESARGRQGSGLGLFLSLRAADQMQARLELESTQPGRGSVFRLELQPDGSGTSESSAEPIRAAED
jgi:signal transduction histidine kinase